MKFYFREATANGLKTYPYILLRIVVGLVLSAGVILALLVSVWAWMTYGTIAGIVALIVILVFVILIGIILRPYLLYLVEAAHVAVLTEIIANGETPGKQFQFGYRQVRANFASVTVLFIIDLAIRRVLKELNKIIDRMVSAITDRIADTGRSREAGLVQDLVGIVQLALNITVSYVDKAIMANIYRSDHENNWKPAKEGVVLYAKTWKPIFASALIVSAVYSAPFLIGAFFWEEISEALGGEEQIIENVETFLIGLSDVGLISLVIVVIGVLTVVQYGVVKPWLTALILTIYLNETAEQKPDEEWEQRLRENSREFRQFERRAKDDSDVEEKTGTWRDYFLP